MPDDSSLLWLSLLSPAAALSGQTRPSPTNSFLCVCVCVFCSRSASSTTLQLFSRSRVLRHHAARSPNGCRSDSQLCAAWLADRRTPIEPRARLRGQVKVE